jgi:signal transduction histidine kinase
MKSKLCKRISSPNLAYAKLISGCGSLVAPVRIPFLLRQRMTASLSNAVLRLQRWQIITFLLITSVALSSIELLIHDAILSRTLSPAVAYAVPVLAMAWFVDRRWAYVNAFITTGLLTIVHVFTGIISSKDWLALLNSANRLLFYIILIEILTRLKFLQKNLETLAESRARDLASEVALNLELQRELIEASEHEQKRIGQDLHDGLCQHLTGTALASQFLFETLQDEGHPMAVAAHKIVNLVEDGISQTRSIAKGLYPIDKSADSLMQALEDFTTTTSDLFGIECRLSCDTPILIEASSIANHLYRIAQEAVNNAVRHGRATKIEIVLEESDSGIRLSIADNGIGLSNKAAHNKGLGLRTMADRAKSIGGQFYAGPALTGGVKVVCVAPGPR